MPLECRNPSITILIYDFLVRKLDLSIYIINAVRVVSLEVVSSARQPGDLGGLNNNKFN
jgi:hypothetical protein